MFKGKDVALTSFGSPFAQRLLSGLNCFRFFCATVIFSYSTVSKMFETSVSAEYLPRKAACLVYCGI
jgi:hypothetical protein